MPKAVASAIAEIERRFGRLDALVNNAGIAVFAPLLETSDDDWNRVLAVNLTGPFLCTKAAAPLMREHGGGAIVNITSISAVRASTLRSAYGTSKAGLAHLTKQLAVELASLGIRVNGVAPGPVETAMAKAVHTPEIRADYHDAIPLNRYGLEEELAEAVFFLCSDRASYNRRHLGAGPGSPGRAPGCVRGRSADANGPRSSPDLNPDPGPAAARVVQGGDGLGHVERLGVGGDRGRHEPDVPGDGSGPGRDQDRVQTAPDPGPGESRPPSGRRTAGPALSFASSHCEVQKTLCSARKHATMLWGKSFENLPRLLGSLGQLLHPLRAGTAILALDLLLCVSALYQQQARCFQRQNDKSDNPEESLHHMNLLLHRFNSCLFLQVVILVRPPTADFKVRSAHYCV